MAETADVVIVGAGVVGLATARALARQGREVLVLEREDRLGTGISSRHSEVIHAGLYYPTGSLKARLCVRGRQLLYPWLAAHAVPHRQTGKLIVATDDDQHPALKALIHRGQHNGVTDLSWLEPEQVAEREPALRVTGAIYSPSTGILDSHRVMTTLWAEAEAHGAMLAPRSPVIRGRCEPLEVETPDLVIQCRTLILCAGLGTIPLARRLRGLVVPPRQYLARGNYFALRCRSPFRHLVYPAPVSGGLGIHLTLDLAGRARFGPDVEWIDAVDFAVPPQRVSLFEQAVRRYWPGLPDDSLVPDYSGIRPKLTAPPGGFADFQIVGPATHGVTGLVALYGIESPGFTSALAIAEHVAHLRP